MIEIFGRLRVAEFSSLPSSIIAAPYKRRRINYSLDGGPSKKKKRGRRRKKRRRKRAK
jgi:hypothetical protein